MKKKPRWGEEQSKELSKKEMALLDAKRFRAAAKHYLRRTKSLPGEAVKKLLEYEEKGRR